jgi:hypothetical protein
MLSSDLFEEEAPRTRVINIRSRAPYDILIARPSIWGNVFSHLPLSRAKWRVQTREEAIWRYEEYVRTRPDLIARLPELEGKILGCWCSPQLCHGDVLIRLIFEFKRCNI